ncbi:MAG TPA: hypothetical protein VEL07_08055 [Planctomycetota bacterium]|nr:hypothetical protein [Planctomycetota bacterium]
MDAALILGLVLAAAVDHDEVLIAAADAAPAAASPAVATASALDRVRLADGAEVVGRASIGALRVVAACGPLDLVGSDIAGIARDGGALALIALADGGRVQGLIADGRIDIAILADVVASFPLADVVELALASPSSPPTHDGPWLCVGATRLRARWTADTVTVRTAAGALTVPTRTIAAVQPASVEHALGAVTLRDGGRLCGMVRTLPASALATDAAPSADWGIDAGAPAPAQDAARLRLSGGDLLVGTLGEIRLTTAHGDHRLPAGSVRRLTPHPRDERVFAVELVGGGRLEGRLMDTAIGLVADWATLAIPATLVRSYE